MAGAGKAITRSTRRRSASVSHWPSRRSGRQPAFGRSAGILDLRPSYRTRRLLVEEGGFLYDSDAYNDDLPYFVQVGGHRHLVLPYAFDTNDMQFFHTQRFSGAADFAEYVIEAFDWLHREGAHAPKMLSVGLHLRMIGRPGRIGALDRISPAHCR
jgi:peptidoglycan/xylan/chitin deacetylase (PgdA/CDA1 family)